MLTTIKHNMLWYTENICNYVGRISADKVQRHLFTASKMIRLRMKTVT